SGNQDVCWLALEARALGAGRVAAPNRNGRCPEPIPARRGHLSDACERGPKISFDVHRKRLERRDVQNPASFGFWRRLPEHQSVEAPQEGRQCLSTTSRREDQRRFASRDRSPAELLGSSRGVERRREPRSNGRMKGFERIEGRRSPVAIL